MAFPDLALHCVTVEELLAGGDTVTRTPELVIEILGEETAERDRAPRGAKFLAYQLCGAEGTSTLGRTAGRRQGSA